MVCELPKNDRDEEIVDDSTEPTPPKGETPSPTLGATSGDDDFAAGDDLGSDGAPELTPDVPSAELGGDAAAEEIPTLPPSDAETSEAVVDSAGVQDPSTSAEPPSQPRKVATKTDWSNFVPAPAETSAGSGRIRFLDSALAPSPAQGSQAN